MDSVCRRSYSMGDAFRGRGDAAADVVPTPESSAGSTKSLIEAERRMPAVSSLAYLRASDNNSRIPPLAMSRMVNTWNAGISTICSSGVEIAGADDNDVCPGSFGLKPRRSTSSGPRRSHYGRERHSWNSAWGERSGVFIIAVGIEPKVADLFFLFAGNGWRRQRQHPRR